MWFADLARRLGRTMGRDLWHAVATGPDEPAPWLRRVRVTAPVLPFLLAAAVGGSVLLAPYVMELQIGMRDSWWPVVLLLTAGVLVLSIYRPLLAWRLACLALLYELTITSLTLRGLPLPTLFVSWLQIVTFLAVLFAVAASQPRGVAFWVWLITGLPAWAVPLIGTPDSLILLRQAGERFVRAGAGEVSAWSDLGGYAFRVAGAAEAIPGQLVAVGLVTGVVLAGQLTRYRTRTRRRLAVAEEHQLVLAERARIARELHDVIAHHMSMIAVRAETAPYRLRAVPEPARAEFAQISHESRNALTEMRRMLGVLRSGDRPAPPTAPQPGLTDLADLVETARAAGATVTLEMHGAMADLPPAVDVSGYRIVQEALTNATRHAAGAPVRITLRRTGTELSLLVRNQAGRPAGPRGAPGHGVRGMRERVAALGGQLRAEPTSDGGFEVSATIPLTGAVPS